MVAAPPASARMLDPEPVPATTPRAAAYVHPTPRAGDTLEPRVAANQIEEVDPFLEGGNVHWHAASLTRGT